MIARRCDLELLPEEEDGMTLAQLHARIRNERALLAYFVDRQTQDPCPDLADRIRWQAEEIAELQRQADERGGE